MFTGGKLFGQFDGPATDGQNISIYKYKYSRGSYKYKYECK